MATKKSDPANRGKGAESTIKEILGQLEKDLLGFCFNRNLDAHAAGGRFPAQAGDYQAFLKGFINITHAINKNLDACGIQALWSTGGSTGIPANRNFIIEVKEVGHDRLLPPKNYSSDKVARVYKRTLAGTEAIVMVKHTTTGFWRAVPLEFFRVRPENKSWDLASFPYVDPTEALKEFFGVK